MNAKEETLLEAGLNHNEAKIYISLLETGITTAGNIAKNTKLHRTNTYDSLKKLIEKGLVSYIKQDNSTLYEATNPQALLRLIKEKENRVKATLPQLLMLKKLSGTEGEANIYKGIPAFMSILYDLLAYKDEIRAYGIPKLAPQLMKTRIPHFHKDRISKKIGMKHIYNHNARERIEYLNTLPYTEAKHLPEIFYSEASTVVCGDEVIITLWTKKDILSIRIKSSQIAESYKKYFELLWKGAK